MKHFNRKLRLVLIAALAMMMVFALMGLVGCDGTGTDDAVDTGPVESAEPITLTVGATPAPHSEILEFLKPKLAEDGIDLEIVVYTDFVLPNNALAAGDIDANYFQHVPFLQSFNDENGTDLSAVRGVHFEPLGIYPGRAASIDDLEAGSEIAIPADPTNGARALNLLEAAGIIVLEEAAGLFATPRDIAENPFDVTIREVEAAQLPRILPDVDLAVINGNFALEAGLAFEDAIQVEDKESEAAQAYTNYLVTNTDRVNEAAIQTLGEWLNSEEVRTFILERYEGRVVPTF